MKALAVTLAGIALIVVLVCMSPRCDPEDHSGTRVGGTLMKGCN